VKLLVTVPGEIVPAARVRVSRGCASTPRTTVEYQATIARATRAARAAHGWATSDGPVEIRVTAFGLRRGDPVYVLKSALDGLVKGEAISDDSVRVIRSLTIECLDSEHLHGLVIQVTPC